MLIILVAVGVLLLTIGLYLFVCKAGYKRGYYAGYNDGYYFGVEDAKGEYHERILLAEYEKRKQRQAAIRKADHLRVVK